MGVLKLHGHPYSGATLRVLSVLHEKGLEFEFVPIDLATGEHKKEHFLSLNPFGQVPAFEDGEIKMFESRAITQYLAHAYADRGTELLFKETKKMAEMSVWAEVEAQKFDPPAFKVVFELILKPMIGGGAADEATVAEQQAALSKVLDVYEARLAGSSYLSGDSFGLADAHHQPLAAFDSRPYVSRWAADILSRPAWVNALAQQSNAP
ncbi:unnamed protein product [Spirodela intermedia]|uniref:glutathione transferase n=1 Tax=Spirodela intermedia TaxID=51605 RepID=A0A7I8IVN6_SPIIN|nr:unnamed protein product [Spirodela intermedia]CAA6662056.1 unnamed protein product [Spirodela intermedia]